MKFDDVLDAALMLVGLVWFAWAIMRGDAEVALWAFMYTIAKYRYLQARSHLRGLTG